MPDLLKHFRRARTPPPPIPQPLAVPVPDDELVTQFDALALANPNNRFVGGLVSPSMRPGPPNDPRWAHLNYLNEPPPPPAPSFPIPSTPLPPGPLPTPPTLLLTPTPDQGNRPSLTMQHALSAPPNIAPTESTSVPGSRRHSGLNPDTTPAQATPGPPRASSTPPSPIRRTSSGGSDLCSGWTVKNQPCKNKVKSTPAAIHLVDPEAIVERRCHIHAQKLLEEKSFPSARGGGSVIYYADWVPTYLDSDTQCWLREEMSKKIGIDSAGYIYAYKIEDPTLPSKILIKVGRSVNATNRIQQWKKQCPKRELVALGCWPESDDPQALMPGFANPPRQTRYCHRLERLIHLELASLMRDTPYLDRRGVLPKPSSKAPDNASNSNSLTSGSASPSGRRSPGRSGVKAEPCSSCGKNHKEIFTFDRATRGPYKGKEWDLLVREVIRRWGTFVDEHMYDGMVCQ